MLLINDLVETTTVQRQNAAFCACPQTVVGVWEIIQKASSESPDNLYGSRAWVFHSDLSTLSKKIIFSFLGFGLKSARIQETAGRIWTSISGDHLLNFNSNSRILNSKFRIFNSKFRIFNSKIWNLLQYAGKKGVWVICLPKRAPKKVGALKAKPPQNPCWNIHLARGHTDHQKTAMYTVI